MVIRWFGTSLPELLAPSLAWIWSGERAAGAGAGNGEGGKADTQEKKKKGKEEKEKEKERKKKKAEEEAKRKEDENKEELRKLQQQLDAINAGGPGEKVDKGGKREGDQQEEEPPKRGYPCPIPGCSSKCTSAKGLAVHLSSRKHISEDRDLVPKTGTLLWHFSGEKP